MEVIYQATSYEPDIVTGRYVRFQGKKRGFRVFEAATGRSRNFEGRPGMGPTLREWDTDGTDLPADVKDRALAADHTMIQWD